MFRSDSRAIFDRVGPVFWERPARFDCDSIPPSLERGDPVIAGATGYGRFRWCRFTGDFRLSIEDDSSWFHARASSWLADEEAVWDDVEREDLRRTRGFADGILQTRISVPYVDGLLACVRR